MLGIRPERLIRSCIRWIGFPHGLITSFLTKNFCYSIHCSFLGLPLERLFSCARRIASPGKSLEPGTWFILAPDPRFANALFCILPITAVLPLLLAVDASGKLWRVVLAGVFLVVNAYLLLIFFREPLMFDNFSFKGVQPLPVVSLVQQKTNSGLMILTPVKGDQCWDSDLPCTPYFNSKLSFKNRLIFPEFYLQTGKKKTK